MAATKFDIMDWLEEANKKRATHVIIMRNLDSKYDYPIEIDYDEKIEERVNQLKLERNRCIIAVYDLLKDLEPQIANRSNGGGILF